MLSDIRAAVRAQLAQPAFTLAAVLILAIGIGVNTAVFSVANVVLLQSLPYPEPESLVALFEARPRERVTDNVVSIADFLDWRDHNTKFSHIAAYESTTYNLTTATGAEQIHGALVTARYFETVGVRPSRGRDFDLQDESRETGRSIVVTHGFWQRRLGGDDAIVGRTFTLNGWPHIVAGVLPPEFTPPVRNWEIFGVMRFDAASRSARGNHNLSVIARLKHGVTLAQARQEMDVISRRLEAAHPVNRGHYANVVPLDQAQWGKLRPAMSALLAAVALVLLIACFNVANLSLARSVTRAREISIRLAIGATRTRIVRLLLIDSLILALVAAVAGVLLAVWGMDFLRSLVPEQLGLTAEDIRMDMSVLLYAILIAVASGVLTGLAPAFTAGRGNVHDALRSGSWQQTWSVWRQRQRAAIVIAEMAISVVLLVCAGLLVRSFINLVNVDPGFHAEKLLTMGISLPASNYMQDAKKIALQKNLLQNVTRLPGVQRAGITSFLPFTGQNSRMGLVIEGIDPEPDVPRRANWRLITPGYIETMQIALRKGRLFTETDTQQTPIVMLINETAERSYWGERDPIGMQARLSSMSVWAVVVGVVADVKHWGLDEGPRPEAYLSLWQAPFWQNNLVVRTQGDPLALAQQVRQTLRSLDKDLPPASIQSMQEVIDKSTGLRRFYMLLLGILASIALVLAAAGIYAQLAYSVSQRMREIGLRMALGARPRDMVNLIAGQGLAMSLTGAVVGLALAVMFSRFLETLLFGVRPIDPLTLVIAPFLLLVVSTIASVVPAWRAANADLAASLRYE